MVYQLQGELNPSRPDIISGSLPPPAEMMSGRGGKGPPPPRFRQFLCSSSSADTFPTFFHAVSVAWEHGRKPLVCSFDEADGQGAFWCDDALSCSRALRATCTHGRLTNLRSLAFSALWRARTHSTGSGRSALGQDTKLYGRGRSRPGRMRAGDACQPVTSTTTRALCPHCSRRAGSSSAPWGSGTPPGARL